MTQPTQTEDVEADLANLVNMAGKMRMLSHRTVMFALLCQTDPSHNAVRDTALAEFDRLRAILRDPLTSQAVGPIAAEALRTVSALPPATLQILDEFIARAKRVLGLRGPDAATPLTELGLFVAGELLAALDAINDGIRAALALVAQNRRDREAPIVHAISDTLSQIDRLALSLRMVATNASIEAQRQGDAGRSFRILAEEMRSLSDKSRGFAENLGALLSDVRP